MLRIYQPCNTGSIIGSVENHILNNFTDFLPTLLRLLYNQLKQILIHHAHRYHHNLQVFVRFPCSKAELNTKFNLVSSHPMRYFQICNRTRKRINLPFRTWPCTTCSRGRKVSLFMDATGAKMDRSNNINSVGE